MGGERQPLHFGIKVGNTIGHRITDLDAGEEPPRHRVECGGKMRQGQAERFAVFQAATNRQQHVSVLFQRLFLGERAKCFGQGYSAFGECRQVAENKDQIAVLKLLLFVAALAV